MVEEIYDLQISSLLYLWMGTYLDSEHTDLENSYDLNMLVVRFSVKFFSAWHINRAYYGRSSPFI